MAVAMECGTSQQVLQKISYKSRLEVWIASKDGDDSKNRLAIQSGKQCLESDAEARRCFKVMEQVADFFENYLGVFPVNNHDKLMRCVIHYPKIQHNHAWHGPNDKVHFGDANPKYFQPFASNLEAVTHEFGHAVIQYYGNLGNEDETGALNESIADVLAIAHKQFRIGDRTDWLLSPGLLNSVIPEGAAIRSMRKPGKAFSFHPIMGKLSNSSGTFKDPQVGKVKEYVHTKKDNGGIHINSGIPSRAFYLTTKRMEIPSWEMAKIWLAALRQTNFDDFSTFAGRTVQVTREWMKNSANSLKFDADERVVEAWREVGVEPKEPVDSNSAPPSLNVEPKLSVSSSSSAMDTASDSPPMASSPSSGVYDSVICEWFHSAKNFFFSS